MLQQIKITEISILDKRILADSLNAFGEFCRQQYVNDSDNRGHLMQYSIAQGTFHELTQLFNSAKVLRMERSEELDHTRSLKLKIHTALVAISALQHYEGCTSDIYIKSRCDVLWNKIENQLI